MFKYTQRAFNGGVLDKELMGRQDLSKYFCGASILKNFLVRRQGNLAKRRGTDFGARITNILGYEKQGDENLPIGIGKVRLVPITRDRERGYYAMLTGRRAFLVDSSKGILCNDGAWRSAVGDYEYVGEFSRETDGECVCEGQYYATLADAVVKAADGARIDLRKDATVSVQMPSCRGVINLNGHTLTMKGPTAALSFCGGSWSVGLVDYTYPTSGSNVVWTETDEAEDNVFVTAFGVGSLFVLKGIRASFPYVTADSSIVRIVAGQSAAIHNCSLSTSAKGGVVRIDAKGDSFGSGGVTVSETDITFGATATTAKAINNASLVTEDGVMCYRAVKLVSSSLTVTGSSAYASTYGLVVGENDTTWGTRAGAVVLTAGASKFCSDTATGSKIVDGLVRIGTVTNPTAYISSGSACMTTRTVDGVVYGDIAPTGQSSSAYSRSPEEEEDPEEYPEIPTNENPHFVAVPYEDGDLAELDVVQSGDTLFLSHKSYPPAKLTLASDGLSIAYERIAFGPTAWKRPVITGITNRVNFSKSEASGSGGTAYKTTVSYSVSKASCTKTTTVYKEGGEQVAQSVSTLMPRTVKYCVTYVKDGIESPPSNPVEMTYAAPWESGGKATVSFGRGENADDPDYYNVYKKESTEFGLIGSTSRMRNATFSPTPDGYSAEAGIRTLTQGVARATFNGVSIGETQAAETVNFEPRSAIVESPVSVTGDLGECDVWRGIGGVGFGNGCAAILDFGENSGASVGTLHVYADAHTLRYAEDAETGTVKVYDVMRLGGKRITATATYANKSGAQTASTQTVTATLDPMTWNTEDGESRSAYTGTAEAYLGSFAPGAGYEAVKSLVKSTVREATFAFSAIDGDKQVSRIVLSFEEEGASMRGETTWQGCVGYACGFGFETGEAMETSFDDDYITPDLTVTPPSADGTFDRIGDYPSCVGLYQQRLIYAATHDQPFGFWMSAVGDLYNFTPHSSIREDDAISAELAATEFPNINHVVVNRDIIMLGDGGEWKVAPVTGNTITYKTVSAELQSSIGSAKWLKPITVGEQVVFAERTGMTLRSIVYNYASDGYESTDLTVLSGDLFANNRIERMCYKQHPDSTIECVLADGTLAAMVYMPEHEVAAWSQCVLGGGYLAKDIATSKALDGNTTDVLLAVRKGDEWELWSVRPDLPELTVDAQTCMDRVQALTAAAAASGWASGWTAVDRATGAPVTAAAGLVSGHTYLCGFAFDAEVATVRPEPAGDGTIQFEVKNAKDVEVRCLNGASWKVAPYGLVDHATYAQRHVFQPTATDGVLALDSSDVRLVLTGKNGGDGRVHLKCSNPYPQSILSVSVDYEIQPVSNQEG